MADADPLIEHETFPLPQRLRGRNLLEVEMEKYLFGGGVEAPAGYVPPES